MKNLSNQSGSILVPVLVLSAVMAVTSGAFLSWFQARQKLQAHSAAYEDVVSLETTLKMILSKKGVCHQSQISGIFGRNFAELDAFSANKKISVRAPINGRTPTLTVGSSFGRLKITGLSFDDSSLRVKTHPLENSFVANLYVSTADSYSKPMKNIVIPFYFETDASGTFTGCFATTYMDPSVAHPVTLENFVCNQVGGSGLVYSLKEKSCIPTSTVTAGP